MLDDRESKETIIGFKNDKSLFILKGGGVIFTLLFRLLQVLRNLSHDIGQVSFDGAQWIGLEDGMRQNL